MTTDLRFMVEMRTTGSNAREHYRVAAARVAKERDAVAAMWTRLVWASKAMGVLVVPDTVLRIPRGTSMQARKLAKQTGADLRVEERVLRPLLPLRVELTRVSARTLDKYNLAHALKATIDQLAHEFGVDDRDPLVDYVLGQEKGPQKYYAVRVRIVVAEAARGAA